MIFLTFIGWSVLGLGVLLIATESSSILGNVDGFEFVNPYWIYKNYKVNYFGTIVLFIIYNLICPLGTICYWFYKLCTIGRKNF
jgi:hypothetical protein